MLMLLNRVAIKVLWRASGSRHDVGHRQTRAGVRQWRNPGDRRREIGGVLQNIIIAGLRGDAQQQVRARAINDVKPLAGLEVDYVPIVTRQAAQ